MKIAILCFSKTGWESGIRLMDGLSDADTEVTLDSKSKYLSGSITESHQEWTRRQFEQSDAIIFIGACGIAVRSIAPFVTSKKIDPAVLVIDECGHFVISLLSGHLGGANELTRKAADVLGAEPVITTATDLHRRFAVDMFAKKNHCELFPMKAAKELSAALLAGEKVGFYSDFPWSGPLPEGLVEHKDTDCSIGIAVSIDRHCNPFPTTVHVVPKVVTLGIGCRKGKDYEGILKAVKQCLEERDIYPQALEGIASINLKREENGILLLAKNWDLPFHIFTGSDLEKAEGMFTSSDFVRSVTGIDNVCERSAVLASGQGKLIQHKTGAGGVTTALAIRDWRIYFE